jgi:hypothetical protein
MKRWSAAYPSPGLTSSNSAGPIAVCDDIDPCEPWVHERLRTADAMAGPLHCKPQCYKKGVESLGSVGCSEDDMDHHARDHGRCAGRERMLRDAL